MATRRSVAATGHKCRQRQLTASAAPTPQNRPPFTLAVVRSGRRSQGQGAAQLLLPPTQKLPGGPAPARGTVVGAIWTC